MIKISLLTLILLGKRYNLNTSKISQLTLILLGKRYNLNTKAAFVRGMLYLLAGTLLLEQPHRSSNRGGEDYFVTGQ